MNLAIGGLVIFLVAIFISIDEHAPKESPLKKIVSSGATRNGWRVALRRRLPHWL